MHFQWVVPLVQNCFHFSGWSTMCHGMNECKRRLFPHNYLRHTVGDKLAIPYSGCQWSCVTCATARACGTFTPADELAQITPCVQAGWSQPGLIQLLKPSLAGGSPSSPHAWTLFPSYCEHEHEEQVHASWWHRVRWYYYLSKNTVCRVPERSDTVLSHTHPPKWKRRYFHSKNKAPQKKPFTIMHRNREDYF